MRLTTDQQEALLHLQRIQLQCDEAQVARQRQMERCYDLGIPCRRISMAANININTVNRLLSPAHRP